MAKVHSGVPQGSVLGPLVFILASGSGLMDIEAEVNASEEFRSSPEVKFYLYADDITCIFSLKNEREKLKIEAVLAALENYSNVTGLRFNASKSQLLRLGNNQLRTDLSLLGNVIPEVRYLKNLGCVFSKTYTFVAMMNLQLAKAKRVMRMIENKLFVRDAQCLKQIYQCYLQSTLLYSSEVWFNLENPTIDKLRRVDESFWELLPNDQEPPVCYNSVQIAVKKNLMLFFKHKFNICRTDLTEEFVTFETQQTRESLRGDLKLPKSNLSVKTREFVTVTTKLFNMLDPIKRVTRLLPKFERTVNEMIENNF